MTSSEIPPIDPSIDLVRRAMDGDSRAMRQLVSDLTPVIRAGVGAVLARGQAFGRRAARQEIEDVTQTVLLALFADRGRVLLQWDPARGRDLPSFVALLARRETVSVLRSRRRSPWTEDPTRLEDLDREPVSRMGPESEAISRDMLAALTNAVRERLTPRGAELFDLLFLEGRQVDEVCELTGMSADAVYAWKSRLTRQVREILEDLGAPPSTIPPPPDGAAGTAYRILPAVVRTRPLPDTSASAPTKSGPIPKVMRVRTVAEDAPAAVGRASGSSTRRDR